MMQNAKFISVTLEGKRWKNEAGDISQTLANLPGAVAYSVADSAIVESVGSNLTTGGALGPDGNPYSANSSELINGDAVNL